MEDERIIELFFARSEQAIRELDSKYGKVCYGISYNILNNNLDAEECVNDTYWKAWSAIPPSKPKRLAAFLGKITRNLSLDKFRRYKADKRGGGEMALALEELGDCVSSSEKTEEYVDEMFLVETLNQFLASLSTEQRKIFMRRYWYVSSVEEIANEYGISQSKVKMSLLRSRNRLKQVLEEEGIAL